MSGVHTETTQLKPVSEGLWCATGDLWLSGGMHFPVRMTVIRLSHGGLLLHSPIALNEGLVSEIKALGEVQDILAPSLLHHLYVEAAKKAFPQARLWGVKGLQEKRDDLDFDGVVEETLPTHWRTDLEGITLQGSSQTNELLLFHKPSKTLLLVDLLFNIQEPKGWFSPLVFRLVGVYKRLGQSKLWRWVFTDNREAAAKSVLRMLDWPFERVLLCHGDVVDKHAKLLVTKALFWMLGGKKEVEKQLAQQSQA